MNRRDWDMMENLVWSVPYAVVGILALLQLNFPFNLFLFVGFLMVSFYFGHKYENLKKERFHEK